MHPIEKNKDVFQATIDLLMTRRRMSNFHAGQREKRPLEESRKLHETGKKKGMTKKNLRIQRDISETAFAEVVGRTRLMVITAKGQGNQVSVDVQKFKKLSIGMRFGRSLAKHHPYLDVSEEDVRNCYRNIPAPCHVNDALVLRATCPPQDNATGDITKNSLSVRSLIPAVKETSLKVRSPSKRDKSRGHAATRTMTSVLADTLVSRHSTRLSKRHYSPVSEHLAGSVHSFFTEQSLSTPELERVYATGTETKQNDGAWEADIHLVITEKESHGGRTLRWQGRRLGKWIRKPMIGRMGAETRQVVDGDEAGL